MLKIRIEGLPEDVEKYLKDFRKNNRVLQESGQYQNRNSKYVRAYLEIEQPKKGID